jgi:hypothetical protein
MASASSGISTKNAVRKNFVASTSQDTIRAATRTQDVQTSLAINWRCAARMGKK